MNFMGSLYTFVDFVEGLYLNEPGKDDEEEEEEDNEENNDDDDDDDCFGEEDDENFDGDEKREVTK